MKLATQLMPHPYSKYILYKEKQRQKQTSCWVSKCNVFNDLNTLYDFRLFLQFNLDV